MGEIRELAHGAIGSARVTAFGVSNVAPAGAVVGGLVIVVSYAGFAAPLVVLIALVTSLCCAISIAEFARRLPSAGSLYYGGARTFGYLAGAAGLSVVLIYLAVNVSSIRAFRATFRDEFRLWRHLLVPATATVFFLFPLWGILHPHGRTLMDLCIPQPDAGGITLMWVTISQDGPTGWSRGSDHSVPGGGCPASRCLRSASSPPACWPRPPFFLACALLLGIPVYMAQRRHLTRPALVSAYR